MLQIDAPRYVQLPQGRNVTVGDEAVVHATPGLIALLEAAFVEGGAPIGAGYQAPLTVPFGIAVTAALGALGATDPHQERWMVRSAAIAFSNRASRNDRIEAKARVVRLTQHDAFVETSARGSASGALLSAELRVIALQGGRYAAVASGELPQRDSRTKEAGLSSHQPSRPTDIDPLDHEHPLLELRSPHYAVTTGAMEATFHPGVAKLLINPVAGHRAPLGRRVHPLGGAPLGAALATAFAAAGESDPDRPSRLKVVRANATWLVPLSLDAPFLATTRRDMHQLPAATMIEVSRADGRVVLRAGVELV